MIVHFRLFDADQTTGPHSVRQQRRQLPLPTTTHAADGLLPEPDFGLFVEGLAPLKRMWTTTEAEAGSLLIPFGATPPFGVEVQM